MTKLSHPVISVLVSKFSSIKAKYVPAKKYFCEVEFKDIEYPPTIEVNLNNQDLGVEGFRELLTILKEHGLSVQFFNGSRFYHKHVSTFINEGLV